MPFLTTFFLNKHMNGKKLSSHMWFFEGFCRFLLPKYCCFVDVGTVPDETGVINYFKAMESDIQIGGLSGYMGLYFNSSERDGFIDIWRKLRKRQTERIEKKMIQWEGKRSRRMIFRFIDFIWNLFIVIHTWVDVRKAQLWEYNWSHMMDKNFLSFFGFLHVLLGAWSFYRYSSLDLGEEYRQNLLQRKYLKTALNPE